MTRRNVLLECLRRYEDELKEVSVNEMGLEPLEDMEEAFAELQERCGILRDMIQALQSEPVERAIANWQREVMEADAAGWKEELRIG